LGYAATHRFPTERARWDGDPAAIAASDRQPVHQGARSSIAHLDLVDLEIPGGGRLRLSLESIPPASMKRLGKLFETLATVINAGAASDADLEINDPDEQCLFMQALRQASPRR
jgi:hypothetical protein